MQIYKELCYVVRLFCASDRQENLRLRAKNIKKINIVKKSEKKLKVCCWSNFFNLNMLHQNNKVRRPYVTNINFIKQHLNTKIAKTPKNENFRLFIKKSG